MTCAEFTKRFLCVYTPLDGQHFAIWNFPHLLDASHTKHISTSGQTKSFHPTDRAQIESENLMRKNDVWHFHRKKNYYDEENMEFSLMTFIYIKSNNIRFGFVESHE